MREGPGLPSVDQAYLNDFNRRAVRLRIPISGNIDLTHRCNLRCSHCYLGKRRFTEDPGRPELTTAQWMKIIDDTGRAGCLNLLITGGEPLLRPDFADIYRYARVSGLIVTVFTNGTLVSDEIVELFREFPPKAVEISIYGASAKTAESITGVPGSFQACIHGLDKLLERKIPVRLKSMLMKQNIHEFGEIERLAQERGVKFRFDPALFPGLDGSRAPLLMRVSEEEAVEKEFADAGRAGEWKDFYARMEKIPRSSRTYPCGAGQTHFHIDAAGYLQPCLMVTNIRYDLLSGDFIGGWNGVIARIGEKHLSADNRCKDCHKRILCGYCPGFFNLEKGAEDRPSEYLCGLGQRRLERIERMS